jgi:hypothetical protein
VLPKL